MGGAVLLLLFVVRFGALRAKKRTTDKMEGTLLPYILSRGALWAKGRQSGV
jgi:hypothetical protein